MKILFGFMLWAFGWVMAGVWFLCRALLIAWAALAIYYSDLPWAWLRVGFALAFVIFAMWALWLSRYRWTPLIFAALYVGVVAWWVSITPSHNRNWRPEVAVMPRATIDGDRVRITGVRNFDYRSRNDFTVRYEEREVQLSHLTGLDFYVSYFMEGPVGHTFVSFIFDDAPPLSVSIETRPEVGEGFAPVASMFKQFGGRGSVGLGFAIPIAQARTLLLRVQAGETKQGVLGVSLQRLTPDLASASSATGSVGALVAQVQPGSPASKVGLLPGDIITSLADQPIERPSDLNRAISLAANTTRSLSFKRDGKDFNVSVAIPETSESAIILGQLPAPVITSVADLGLAVRSTDRGEVVIESVAESSIAEVTGFKAGDVVLAVQSSQVTKASEFDAAVAESIANKVSGLRVLLSDEKGQRWVYLAISGLPRFSCTRRASIWTQFELIVYFGTNTLSVFGISACSLEHFIRDGLWSVVLRSNERFKAPESASVFH